MNSRIVLPIFLLSCFVFTLPGCSVFSSKKTVKQAELQTATAPSTIEWKEREWEVYAEERGVTYYFEKESITYPRKNIVHVWRKREFRPKISSHKAITAFDEFDCRDEKYRSLQVQGVNWDDTTTPIYQRPAPWTPIDIDEPDYHFIVHYCK